MNIIGYIDAGGATRTVKLPTALKLRDRVRLLDFLRETDPDRKSELFLNLIKPLTSQEEYSKHEEAITAKPTIPRYTVTLKSGKTVKMPDLKTMTSEQVSLLPLKVILAVASIHKNQGKHRPDRVEEILTGFHTVIKHFLTTEEYRVWTELTLEETVEAMTAQPLSAEHEDTIALLKREGLI